MTSAKISRAVSIWLFIGCMMVLIQILIGGITRLTDSGLSITEWEIVKGTLPPLTDKEWVESFDKYKTFAKKQYEALHSEMSLEEFKRIYFWEYFHRLWARFMGFVFAIPFIYFLIRKKISAPLVKRLAVVIFLAALSATFGWIMVASGLNDDKRTWVNAYNLLIHLILATSLFSYLVYTFYQYTYPHLAERIELEDRYLWKWIGGMLFIQLGFGALMAGMKAALVFPYPILLAKISLFQEIWNSSPAIEWAHWNDYEPNPNVKLIVQILHRLTAYILFFVSVWFFIINRVKMFIATSYLFYYVLLIVQIVLGLLTITYSQGQIPITLGVVHQITAFLLLAAYIWILYSSKKRK